MVDYVKYEEIFEAWFDSRNGDQISEVNLFLNNKCGRKLTKDEEIRTNSICKYLKGEFKLFKKKHSFLAAKSSWLQKNFYFDLTDVGK